jgi:hypothetical protein
MTSQQTAKRLLCRLCEDQFGRREKKVAELTEIDAANLEPRILNHVSSPPTTSRQVAAILDHHLADTIAYFAVSVLWRSWAMNEGGRLGKYGEEFRTYLLGETDFPGNAAICLGILEPSNSGENPYTWVSAPASIRTGVRWLHGFMIRGLLFRCYVGGLLNPECCRVCLAARDPSRVIIYYLWIAEAIQNTCDN